MEPLDNIVYMFAFSGEMPFFCQVSPTIGVKQNLLGPPAIGLLILGIGPPLIGLPFLVPFLLVAHTSFSIFVPDKSFVFAL